ncbi:MAG: hypothetical protein M3304_01725, partial [Actinomycetota bacterium]|nr:hypothetical protein [Actinomycetota bacterium]
SQPRAREAPAPEPRGEPPPSPPGAREKQPSPEEEPPLRLGVPPPRLAPLPSPADESEGAAEASTAPSRVVRLDDRREVAREWNVWELDRLAREEARQAPGRADDLSYLLLHLRRFATPGGDLPREFDGLVRESFGPLLARLDRA